MPKLTDAHFAARREQILEAAFNCLARKGYSRMTIRDIAAEAGISVGTLYLYFENKQAIVKAYSEQGRDQFATGIEGTEGEGAPLEMLGSFLRSLIAFLDEPGSAPVLRVDVELWAEAIHHPAVREVFHDSQRHWLDKLVELVGAARAAGDLPAAVDPPRLARLLLAMLAGLELQKVMEPELALASLADSLAALLAAPAGAGRVASTE